MSGVPNEQQVKELSEALFDLVSARASIERLEAQEKQIKDELVYLKQKGRESSIKIFKLMESMDVASSGNYGYEARMEMFLIQLYRQLHP